MGFKKDEGIDGMSTKEYMSKLTKSKISTPGAFDWEMPKFEMKTEVPILSQRHHVLDKDMYFNKGDGMMNQNFDKLFKDKTNSMKFNMLDNSPKDMLKDKTQNYKFSMLDSSHAKKPNFNVDSFVSFNKSQKKTAYNVDSFLGVSNTSNPFKVNTFLGTTNTKDKFSTVFRGSGDGLKQAKDMAVISDSIGWKRIGEQKGLPMFGDADRDGVANILDCWPKNPRLQDFIGDSATNKETNDYVTGVKSYGSGNLETYDLATDGADEALAKAGMNPSNQNFADVVGSESGSSVQKEQEILSSLNTGGNLNPDVVSGGKLDWNTYEAKNRPFSYAKKYQSTSEKTDYVPNFTTGMEPKLESYNGYDSNLETYDVNTGEKGIYNPNEGVDISSTAKLDWSNKFTTSQEDMSNQPLLKIKIPTLSKDIRESFTPWGGLKSGVQGFGKFIIGSVSPSAPKEVEVPKYGFKEIQTTDKDGKIKIVKEPVIIGYEKKMQSQPSPMEAYSNRLEKNIGQTSTMLTNAFGGSAARRSDEEWAKVAALTMGDPRAMSEAIYGKRTMKVPKQFWDEQKQKYITKMVDMPIEYKDTFNANVAKLTATGSSGGGMIPVQQMPAAGIMSTMSNVQYGNLPIESKIGTNVETYPELKVNKYLGGEQVAKTTDTIEDLENELRRQQLKAQIEAVQRGKEAATMTRMPTPQAPVAQPQQSSRPNLSGSYEERSKAADQTKFKPDGTPVPYGVWSHASQKVVMFARGPYKRRNSPMPQHQMNPDSMTNPVQEQQQSFINPE